MKSFLLGFLAFSTVGYGLSVGDKAPDFTLKGSDGKEYSLSKTLKKDTLAAVIFVATKCPYSNAYNERYNQLADAFMQRQKVAFFPINSNDTEPMDDVKKHATENKYKFPVLKDDTHKVADLYKAERTPEVYLINKDLKVVYAGRIDDDGEGKKITRQDLLQAVDESLTGKPVSVAATKAFGCTIKRKS